MQTIGSSRQWYLFPAGPPLCFGETVITSTKRLVETNGVQLQVTEAGDRGAPVVVLAHGFPELAHSWRHQIPALAAAGYGEITTEIVPAGPFYFAEADHQQYLAKNPGGYCGLGGTGVSCPAGIGCAA